MLILPGLIILGIGGALFLGALYSIYRIFRWWPTRRYRLHLSTAVVLIVFAGGLIGLNIKPGLFDNRAGWSYFSFDPLKGDGWRNKRNSEEQPFESKQGGVLDKYCGFPVACYKPVYWIRGSDRKLEGCLILVFDAVICLFVLAWTLFLMEIAHDPKPE